jgi:cell division protein FtsI/penicillin-binding protein 2
MMMGTTTFGTAAKSFGSKRHALPSGIQAAGKTGSLTRSNPFLHYSWFVGFAPVDKPKVAFAVLLGNPERWQIKAHHAARALLGQYLSPAEIKTPGKDKNGTAITHQQSPKKLSPKTAALHSRRAVHGRI